jgi:hypothetical protein
MLGSGVVYPLVKLMVEGVVVTALPAEPNRVAPLAGFLAISVDPSTPLDAIVGRVAVWFLK